METSQIGPISRVLSFDESHLSPYRVREMASKSEESSSENNNVLETSDFEEGLLSFEGSQSWKNDEQEEEVLPPGNPTYLAKDSHSLTFQWDPCQPPYPLEEDSYSVQIQHLDSTSEIPSFLEQDWRVVYTGQECWAKIKDLKPGSYYAIRVRYDWKAKLRNRSIFSSVVIMNTTASIPGDLQPPLLVGVDQSSLRLLWRDPVEDGGAKIVGFRLQAKLSNSDLTSEGFSDVYNGSQHTFNLTQLHPFTKYTLRIKAVNEVGEGPWSFCSTFMTTGSPPEIPVKFQGQFLTPSVILLNWEALRKTSRFPVEYEIEVQDQNTGSCFYLKTGFENWCEIKCEIEYRFRVRGVNELGIGHWSLPISVQFSGLPPSAPSCPILKSCFQKEAQISWNPPLETGDYPIGFYIAEIMILNPQLDPGGLMTTPHWEVVYQDTACECKIEDLSPGEWYCIRIRAKNEIGWSPPSNVLQFQTLLEHPLKTGVLVAINRTGKSELSEIGLGSTKEDSDQLQNHTSHTFDDSDESHSFDDSHTFDKSHTFDDDKVRDFSADEICDKSVRLSWTDQSVSKDSIFIIEMCCESVRDWESCWKGSGTSCLIQGLSSSTEYTFRIFDEKQGKNRSQQISLQTLSEPPSSPQNLQISQVSASSMKIEWKGSRSFYPEKQDFSNFKYLIKISQKKDISHPVIQTWTSIQDFIKIKGLEANTEYEVQVAAQNKGGKSDWSEKVKIRTKDLPPEPPSNIQTKIMEIENQINLEINWNLVEKSKTNQNCQGFEVEVFGLIKTGKKSKILKMLFSKSSTCFGNSCFVRNLDWNQKYEVRIRGVGLSGLSGPWSKPIKFHTFQLTSKTPKSTSSDHQKRPKMTQLGIQSNLETSRESKRSKKGQVVILNKPTNPLKRRKSQLRVLKSHSGTLFVLCLFFIMFMLIYLTPVI